ncbi:hypothetical protein Tco_0653050 [Tanacetum coccineum]|uniref:Uncharacterized protein n=1 Tax=Tanacetum coccineum TaxID=301880 RepID=A0ABQ4WZC6_9ASTR
MSNTNNNNLQTQASSAHHNAIMEAGGKDRPPMLAHDKMETKDTVSSCLKALQSHLTSLLDDLKDFGRVATFKRTLSQDMDLLEKHHSKEILHEIDCKTALKKLRTMFENTFNSGLRECLQNYTALETYSLKDTIIDDMDFIKKYMLGTILHQ